MQRIRSRYSVAGSCHAPCQVPGGGWLSALVSHSSGAPSVMLRPSLGSSEPAAPGSFLLTALLRAGTPCACFCARWRPLSRATWAGELLLSAHLPMGKLQALIEEGRGHALSRSLVAGTEELLTRAPANA